MLIFSLLSTSAVIFTVASIYTARDVTFEKVMSVVPKVWHRLFVTFLCTFVALLAYNLMALAVLILLALANVALAIFSKLIIFYIVGLLYLCIVWQLANVVSVLEESYGFVAMTKSMKLLKGKLWLAMFFSLTLNVPSFLVRLFLEIVVVDDGWKLGSSVDRTTYEIVCFLLISVLFLFSQVIPTVPYFVCKSYHHENIDKSALSDHLEFVYHVEYAPLKTKGVQLEQSHV
ncbi:hypothetical protein L6164_030409 [Bauhinia variegata]|uniref:Uncharacterized protein n=1 Tax=Bauhinia variegata TaxID=167791 RepID=A0ACB9LCQ0_BAUVA|nr:hypothetical protein L6164_030409 [Bauhinia variegata]